MFGRTTKTDTCSIPPPPIPILIGYAVRGHWPRIHRINRLCPYRIAADALDRALGDPWIASRIALRGCEVAGFAQYAIREDCVELLRLGVDPDYRRRGVGRALADDAKDALARTDRPRLVFAVRETDLPSLLFWRACGVRATGLIPGRFGAECDGIVFEWRGEAEVLSSLNCPEMLP